MDRDEMEYENSLYDADEEEPQSEELELARAERHQLYGGIESSGRYDDSYLDAPIGWD